MKSDLVKYKRCEYLRSLAVVFGPVRWSRAGCAVDVRAVPTAALVRYGTAPSVLDGSYIDHYLIETSFSPHGP